MTVDWAALDDHVRAVRAARRLRPARPPTRAEPAAGAERTVSVSLADVAAFRVHASSLDRRSPAGSLARGAWGGLQDSAPRSALLSLHARVEGVDPGSWEDDQLAQVWFRWADFVIPRADVAVFTRGALPRDERRAAALDDLGEAVASVLDGAPRPTREVEARLRGLPHPSLVRAAGVSGRFLIRWDARTTVLLPTPSTPTRSVVEAERLRLELARRFLSWHGPARPDGFARWAGVSREDAAATWTALSPELVAVTVDGRERSALGGDVTALHSPAPVRGVRLVPAGDPLLVDPADVAAARDDRETPPLELGGRVTSRVLNSLTGRVLLDGEVVAAWGRAAGEVSIDRWRELGRADLERVEAEAGSLGDALGVRVRVRWL